MLDASSHVPGIYDRLSSKLDYERLRWGKRWTLLKRALHRGLSLY